MSRLYFVCRAGLAYLYIQVAHILEGRCFHPRVQGLPGVVFCVPCGLLGFLRGAQDGCTPGGHHFVK